MKKRITFFFPPKQDIFIKDIMDDLRKDYEVITFTGGDEQNFWRTIHSSDYCWFEWGDENLVGIMRNPAYSKYIVRIHSYEIFNGVHSRINWDKVAKLILVNDSVKQIIQKGIPGMAYGIPIPDEKIQVIYHGINLNKFKIPENKKFNKNVVYVGYLNEKKGINLLIEYFNSIWEHDHEYKFHIAGRQQDLRLAVYMSYLLPQLHFQIQFHGWVQDISKFLEDKDFIMSTSIFESFQLSLMEGMAKECIPLIHNWFGADNIYPREYIFNTSLDLIKILEKYEKKLTKNPNEMYNRLREYAKNNFSFEKQIKETRQMIGNL